ncbi:SRPBCC domain-containing protein [Actinomadura fulvescens]|uniref:SRPBCC domain-containing protein n=1 Tax=Actinomadura fulvescens TaxID=46160 RepID=A0ABP6C049_9ACTN
MGHEFELQKEITLAANPEDVWDAIATGPGVDAWFMGRSEIEPREGGATRFTMAGQTETSTITGWEPAKRFAHRTEPGEDGAFMAIEYLIEGRDGGGTVLRLVHSGVLGGDWENEFEAMKTGWDMYLHTLGQYLLHFRGRSAGTVSAFRPGVSEDGFWAALKTRLGLGSTVAEGDRVSLSVEGLDPIEGVVDYADLPSFLGVRTNDALYRFIYSGAHRGSVALLGHHLFAPGLDSGQAEKTWQGWLNELPVG